MGAVLLVETKEDGNAIGYLVTEVAALSTAGRDETCLFWRSGKPLFYRNQVPLLGY
jgi:hypothetical protein